MEAAASGSLRERLRLAVDGFGQLAGLVCQGALVQVWLPVLNASTGTCDDLQTKGQPHTITGEHDMQLRLFRAACSELTLHAADNSADSETVRAALQRREVSVFADVCALPAAAYPRAAAAAKSGVQGSMLIPLFPHKDLDLIGPVAVLELVKLESDNTCFAGLFNWLLENLPMLNLHMPRRIAHWLDATGRDVMAQPQPPTDAQVTSPAAPVPEACAQQQQPAAVATAAAEAACSMKEGSARQPQASTPQQADCQRPTVSVEAGRPGLWGSPAPEDGRSQPRGLAEANLPPASGRGDVAADSSGRTRQSAHRQSLPRQSAPPEHVSMSQPKAADVQSRGGTLQAAREPEQISPSQPKAAKVQSRGITPQREPVCDGDDAAGTSRERTQTAVRAKAGAQNAAEQPFSPGSNSSEGTTHCNSHVTEADNQAHDLASALEDNAELAPEVHHRRVPLADDIGEDSGESSGRALQLSFAELKAHFGVPLTEAAARLGVQRQDLVRSCREHNLEGWPRLSMSVNEAARSDGVPATSLPSDVDAADMAAFIPFGPKAHRTTPASSWRTNSVHARPRLQAEAASRSGRRSRRAAAADAAACHSAVAGGADARMLEPEADPVGSPQEDGESNEWVGYAKGLMLPVQSPCQTRTHGEGLDAAAAQLPPLADADAGANVAQRQPQSSCWQKDNDPFGDKRWERAERLRRSQSAESLGRPPQLPLGDVPPRGSTYTGMSLAKCLGEHGISTADIVEAAALIGMAPMTDAPDQAVKCLGSPPPITFGQPRALQQSPIETLWALNSMAPVAQRELLPEQQEPVLSTPQSALLSPHQPTPSEACRRALLGDLDTAAGRAAEINPLSRPTQEIRLAFEQGVCARARAPFSGCTAVVRDRQDASAAAAQPSSSGTTVSDGALATQADADAEEVVESQKNGGQSLLSRGCSRGRRKKGGKRRGRGGSARGKGRGDRRGDRPLAVATATVFRGPKLFRGGGRARLRKAAAPREELAPESVESQPEQLERVAASAEPLDETAAADPPQASPQPQEQEAEERTAAHEGAAAASQLLADAAEAAKAPAPAAAEERPPFSPAEPAASEPLLRELGSALSRGVPARPTCSEPLPCTQPLDNADKVTSALTLAVPRDDAQRTVEPCSFTGPAEQEAHAAQQDILPEAETASEEPVLAAAVPATRPVEDAAASGPPEQSSRLPEVAEAGAEAATALISAPETSAEQLPPRRLAPAAVAARQQRCASGGSGGFVRGASGRPKKRGRPPQMVPHPHTGQLVRKRDLIAARIDPTTGECRAGKKRKPKAVAAQNKESSLEEGGSTKAPFAVPSRSDKHKRPVKKSRKVIEAEEAQDLSHMEVEGPAQDATEAGAAAGDSCHPVGEADAEQEPRRKQLKMQALLADCPRPEPHTPTRGTSALVYMSTPTSRPRNALLASPTARKFPASEQEVTCDEQLPERLPEPNEAALQGFLADALNFSPPRPLPGIPPFGGGSLFGGGGSVMGSPLSRLHDAEHQMFYGGPFADLGSAAFPDLADSFSFGCFT